MASAQYDIIFAGGGTTACVIAGRLSGIDPSLRILIIESGQHARDVPEVIQPARAFENLDPNKDRLSYYVGKPSVHLNGRSPFVSCGKNVGGGSAVNFMMYVRGAASDYDDWAAMGNEGWSFEELLPFITKLETFTPISGQTTHGYEGPVKVSGGGDYLDIGRQFLDVAKEYDQNRQQVDDNNDFMTANAYGPAYRYVDPATGRRSDAASTYLYPHADKSSNLAILVGKRVKYVIVEDGRAVGVNYVADPISCPGASREEVTVRATKLIVISAGTLGSPTILERSGIGGSSVLERNNTPLLVHLPGVGENYHDHFGANWSFYVSDETATMNTIWHDPEGFAEWLKQWEKDGTGKVAHNGVEVIVKVRPTDAQLESAGTALQQRWKAFFQDNADKPMATMQPISGSPAHRKPLPRNSGSLGYNICGSFTPDILAFKLYPEISGSIHITSSEDVASPPDFDPDFLTKAGDVEQLTIMYKISRELIRRMPSYRGEVAATHPKFPAGSAAACKEDDIPVLIDGPDIVYTDADNEAIVNFHRDNVMTAWHSLGTCSMKPRNQGGVVDPRLNVYGVEGLKVADLSICPANVGNNTYSTALLIGEKAAAIIAEDLELCENTRDIKKQVQSGWSCALA